MSIFSLYKLLVFLQKYLMLLVTERVPYWLSHYNDLANWLWFWFNLIFLKLPIFWFSNINSTVSKRSTQTYIRWEFAIFILKINIFLAVKNYPRIYVPQTTTPLLSTILSFITYHDLSTLIKVVHKKEAIRIVCSEIQSNPEPTSYRTL